MDIHRYFKRDGAMNRSRLAEAIGISKGRMTQLCEKGAEWPPELALKAEAATDGILDAGALSDIIRRAREDRAA